MRTVGIADLQAHLSQYLERVRRGEMLTVLDRDTPIAHIVPYEAEHGLELRRATRKLRDLRLPTSPSGPTDSLTELLDDRASR